MSETKEQIFRRATILYVNGDYRGDDDLGRLMHDFLCNDPDQMYLSPLAERCRFFKQDPKGVRNPRLFFIILFH